MPTLGVSNSDQDPNCPPDKTLPVAGGAIMFAALKAVDAPTRGVPHRWPDQWDRLTLFSDWFHKQLYSDIALAQIVAHEAMQYPNRAPRRVPVAGSISPFADSTAEVSGLEPVRPANSPIAANAK